MSITTKTSSSYQSGVGDFLKAVGLYAAASIYAKVSGAYQLVSGVVDPRFRNRQRFTTSATNSSTSPTLLTYGKGTRNSLRILNPADSTGSIQIGSRGGNNMTNINAPSSYPYTVAPGEKLEITENDQQWLFRSADAAVPAGLYVIVLEECEPPA